MGHIPIVQNPIFPPVEVEYLDGGIQYDNLGFGDSPRRTGLGQRKGVVVAWVIAEPRYHMEMERLRSFPAPMAILWPIVDGVRPRV